MKQNLLTKGQPASILQDIYLLFISYSMICFWIDLVHMLVTTENTSVVAGYMHV